MGGNRIKPLISSKHQTACLEACFLLPPETWKQDRLGRTSYKGAVNVIAAIKTEFQSITTFDMELLSSGKQKRKIRHSVLYRDRLVGRILGGGAGSHGSSIQLKSFHPYIIISLLIKRTIWVFGRLQIRSISTKVPLRNKGKQRTLRSQSACPNL